MAIEGSNIPERAVHVLREGRKIEAIKITREATGMGLKEAKEAVEAYLERNGGVREAFQSAHEPARNFLALVTTAALIAAAVWWLLFRDA